MLAVVRVISVDILDRSIAWKLFPVLIVGALLCSIGVWFAVPFVTERGIRSDTLENAERTVKQFKAIRGYYTRNVIAKVIKSQALKPTYTHEGADDENPLPATFIHDLSKLLAETGTTFKLYSPYPFPIRAGRELDAFAAASWKSTST